MLMLVYEPGLVRLGVRPDSPTPGTVPAPTVHRMATPYSARTLCDRVPEPGYIVGVPLGGSYLDSGSGVCDACIAQAARVP
jgi:hypothetical protein